MEAFSLGLPRVSNQNFKLVLISKCQTTVYRNILPVYGTFEEKSAIEGILKAQQNQEGDTDTVTAYIFLAKIPCLLFFKMPNNGIPLIYCQFTVHQPVCGAFNDNKTKRGIPMYRLLSRYTVLWQKIRWGFSFCLGFRGRIFFLVVAKTPQCKNQVKI